MSQRFNASIDHRLNRSIGLQVNESVLGQGVNGSVGEWVKAESMSQSKY